MTSKQDREQRRAARLEAEKREAAAERRRMILGYVVAGVLTLAVIAGIVIVIGSGGDNDGTVDSGDFPEAAHIEPAIGVARGFEPDGREGTPPPPIEQGDLERAAELANCELRLDLEDEGNAHFTDVDKEVDYGTSPPTSGDHYGAPTEAGSGALADGAYLETPAISRAVHSLEHGRVELQYSPDLPEADQLEIKGVFDEDPAAMILFPNSEMPFEVAATAWTQLIGCESYEGPATLDALRAFKVTYRGRGPENFPIEVAG